VFDRLESRFGIERRYCIALIAAGVAFVGLIAISVAALMGGTTHSHHAAPARHHVVARRHVRADATPPVPPSPDQLARAAFAKAIHVSPRDVVIVERSGPADPCPASLTSDFLTETSGGGGTGTVALACHAGEPEVTGVFVGALP
jgi:hypothetical protein